MDRPKPTPRDRSRRAQFRRARYLRANPLCAHCLAKGFAVLATELDHRIPLKDGGPDDASNFQSLCRSCHVDKSAKDRGLDPKPVIGLDGWPIGSDGKPTDDD